MTSRSRTLRAVASIATPIAVVVAVAYAGSPGDAQSAAHSCSSAVAPAQLIGQAPVVTGQNVNVMAFPKSTTGDQYLAALRSGSGAAAPVAGQSMSSTFSAISSQMTSQQQLTKSLPSLYASAYGISLDSKSNFLCGGLPPGRYTLVAVSQPTAPPATAGSPTPVPLNGASSALASLQSSAQHVYYSWATIVASDMKALPQTKPPGPVRYPTVLVPPFSPISQYPAHYFTH